MSSISAGTTSTTGLVATSDTTGTLVFQTGATPTTALTIDGSQNVGVGTASPVNYAVFGYGPTIEAFGGRGGSFVTTSSSSTVRGVFSSDSSGAVVNLKTVTNHALAFGINDSEKMRLDSSGQLGIGLTPYATQGNLQVYKSISGGAPATSGLTDANQIAAIIGGSVELSVGAYASGTMWMQPRLLTDFSTNFSLVLQPNGGLLGLGVVPSPWGTTNSSVLQIKNVSIGGLATNDLQLTSNGYFDGANWRYIASSVAVTNYYQSAGAHVWRNAASGTAGNAITFTQAMTLDASGNLLVGTTNSSYTAVGTRIQPNGSDPIITTTCASSTSGATTYNLYSTGAGAFRFYVDLGGTIHATSVVITAISDQRLKENVRDIDTGLSSIMALKPRRFDWKKGKGQDKKNAAGFIAQEFEDVFPECVSTSKAGADGIEYKNINHETLIPTLVKAIQEQQAIITQLQADVAALKGQ